MSKIKAIWFHDGESGYQVGKYGVISITEFEYAGSMGWYPWFRVTYQNEFNVRELNSMFVDGIIAEGFDDEAFEILSRKKRIILCKRKEFTVPERSVRLVPNGILVQPADTHTISEKDLTFVSERKPTSDELKELLFAWKVVKYAKSNSTVISTGTRTLGIGMGQTSRIGAVELALKRAGKRAKGAVMASDAFFPYRDSIDAAAKEGVTAVIAPGGSIRDNESIVAADDADIAFVWSGVRAFLH